MRLLLCWPMLVQRGYVKFDQLELRRSGTLHIRTIGGQDSKSQRLNRLTIKRAAIALTVLVAGYFIVASAASNDFKSEIVGTADIEASQTSKVPANSSSAQQQTCLTLSPGFAIRKVDALVSLSITANYGGVVVTESSSQCSPRVIALLRVTDAGFRVEKIIPQSNSLAAGL